jgi:hypothetical protein
MLMFDLLGNGGLDVRHFASAVCVSGSFNLGFRLLLGVCIVSYFVMDIVWLEF